MRPIVAVSLAVLLSACGRNSPTAPGPPAASTSVTGAFGLTGGVFDATGRPLVQARVEVLDGLKKGAFAVTDDAGAFAFGPVFTSPFMLRASKEGRRAESRLISTAQSDGVFRLAFDLQGDFEVTFAADAACTTVPTEVRTRTYTASFGAATDSFYLGTLGGADFARASSNTSPDYNLLNATVFGDAGHVNFSDPEIWEHVTRETNLSPQTDLAIIGDASGAFDGDGANWSFGGFFIYCPDAQPGEHRQCKVPEIRCESFKHQLRIVRKR